MIETLRIEQLAIVDTAELELGPGLNVLTGETGAGKSIVLGALGLLLGDRASADSLRSDAASGGVEAIFRTEKYPELERELVEQGLDQEDAGDGQSHELVIARTIARGGRSRSRVGGQLVPISTLAALFGERVEISSQRGSQALLDPQAQGRMLDAFAGELELRGSLARQVAAIHSLEAELAELRAASDDNARRQDFLRFQLSEIDAAELQPTELEALATEQARLAHSERLREEGGAAVGYLLGDPSDHEGHGAADGLGLARRLLDGLEELDPALKSVAEQLRSCETELRDAASEVERYVDRIEADPQQLAQVEERLGQLDRLCRKYGNTIEEILEHRERSATELAGVDGADERIEKLANEIVSAGKMLSRDAERLSAARSSAASKLSRRVQRALRELELPQARFQVSLEALTPPAGLVSGPSGLESIEFLFSANKGEPLMPLRRVASGGEISRIFLAVKGALRTASEGMVLVFDEVDAGMGGRVAERIGRTLAELAEHHQVLCITHLPQVAAFAHVHFKVEKSDQGGRTVAQIAEVVGDARVEEIARMAGGESVSDTTRSHARELLRVSSPA